MNQRLLLAALVGGALFWWWSEHQQPSAPTPTPAPPNKKAALYFFTQENCPPCRQLEKVLDDPLVQTALAKLDFQKVVLPSPLADQYGVTATPTLVLVDHRGTHKHAGVLNSRELVAWLSDPDGRPKRRKPWGAQDAAASAAQMENSPGRPVVGGRASPDGKAAVVCDLPASERKKNIASKGLGCCVFRSIDYAARWQHVPELHDLPEQLVQAGIPGGGYPEKVDKVMKQFAPEASYLQDTSGDAGILEAILRTGRLPCVTYNGHDGHYGMGQGIAHMVSLPYFDRQTGWACISDNNFPAENEFVWMNCEEFLQRWKGGRGSGWVVALLSAPPPPIPHN